MEIYGNNINKVESTRKYSAKNTQENKSRKKIRQQMWKHLWNNKICVPNKKRSEDEKEQQRIM